MFRSMLKLSEAEVDLYTREFEKTFGLGCNITSEIDQSRKPAIIATIARSGGMYLAALLENHGFSSIDEHINPFKQGEEEATNKHWDQHFEKLIKNAARSGLHFGIKCSIYDLIPFVFKYKFPGGFDSFTWIYLTRESLIDQAVSLAIAEKSKVWSVHVNDDSSHVAISAIDVPPELVMDRIAIIAEDMRRWEMFFSLFGITPVRIGYDRLSSDPESVIKEIGESCALDVSSINVEVPIAVQRSALNVAVSEQFNKYIAAKRLN